LDERLEKAILDPNNAESNNDTYLDTYVARLVMQAPHLKEIVCGYLDSCNTFGEFGLDKITRAWECCYPIARRMSIE
jgi:hypothetical protein